MKEVKLTIGKKPKTFSVEIPTELKIDDVIGTLILMMNLLVFMKDNKPTIDLHEYHIPENYFEGMGIDVNVEKVASVLWQLFYKYSRKGKNGFSSEGSVIFTGSGYELKDTKKDHWVTTKFSDPFNAFLDGLVDIEGMFQMHRKEIEKWMEQNEPYKK